MPKEHPTPITLQDIAQTAQRTTLQDGMHVPTLIAEGDQKTLITHIERFYPTFDERARQMFMIGLFVAKNSGAGVLQQIFFISEGWMSSTDNGEKLARRPSQDPQRKEVLTVTQRVIQPPKTEMVVFEMKRDRQGILKSVEGFRQAPAAPDGDAHSPLIEAFVSGYLGHSSVTSE